jgi:hypothetical protein
LKNKHTIFLAIILILGLAWYYQYLDSQGTIYETFELRNTTYSANILSVSHDNQSDCEDCINIKYMVGNKTYSDPDANGTHFSVKFKRENEEDLDRMINSRNDGYFIKDELEDWEVIYRIKGVVYGDTCYYRSQKVIFSRTFYATVYSCEGNTVRIEYHLSLLWFIIGWILILILAAIVYFSLKDIYEDILKI